MMGGMGPALFRKQWCCIWQGQILAQIAGLVCCSGVAEDIARQLLVYGRRIPKAELFARIDAVDEETVKEVASRFIYDQELAIAAMGDTQTLPDYNWFRRRTYWLRY